MRSTGPSLCCCVMFQYTVCHGGKSFGRRQAQPVRPCRRSRPRSAAARRLSAALGGNPGIAVRDKVPLTEVSGGQLGVLAKVLHGLLAMTVVMAVLSLANPEPVRAGRARDGAYGSDPDRPVRRGARCDVRARARVAPGLPFALPRSLVAVPVAAILLSLGAATWPARRAARTAPLRAIGAGG